MEERLDREGSRLGKGCQGTDEVSRNNTGRADEAGGSRTKFPKHYEKTIHLGMGQGAKRQCDVK